MNRNLKVIMYLAMMLLLLVLAVIVWFIPNMNCNQKFILDLICGVIIWILLYSMLTCVKEQNKPF